MAIIIGVNNMLRAVDVTPSEKQFLFEDPKGWAGVWEKVREGALRPVRVYSL
jgi:hypothetical protein